MTRLPGGTAPVQQPDGSARDLSASRELPLEDVYRPAAASTAWASSRPVRRSARGCLERDACATAVDRHERARDCPAVR
jgi:hypothetical protein